MGFVFKTPEEKVAKHVAKRDVNSLAKLLATEDCRFHAFKALGTLGEAAIFAVKPYLKANSLFTAWSAAELLKSLGWEPTKPEEHIDYLRGLQQWEKLATLGERGATVLLERILSMGDYAKYLMTETAFCALLRENWLSTGNLARDCSPILRNAAFLFLHTQGGDGGKGRFSELQDIEYQEIENILLFLHVRPALALLESGAGFVDNIVRRLNSYEFRDAMHDIATVGPIIFVLEEMGKDSETKRNFMRVLADKLEPKAKTDSNWMELFSFNKRIRSLDHAQIRGQLRLDEIFWHKRMDPEPPTSSFRESRITDKTLKSALDMYVSGDVSNIFHILHHATAGNEEAIIGLGWLGDLRAISSLIQIRQYSKSWGCVKASAEAIRKIVLLSIQIQKGE
jgi:hypothetical protein